MNADNPHWRTNLQLSMQLVTQNSPTTLGFPDFETIDFPNKIIFGKMGFETIDFPNKIISK